MQDILEQIFGYLRGIWRYRWAAVLVAWMVCVAGWVVVMQIPNSYESNAKLFVDTSSVLKEVVQGIAPTLGDPEQELEFMTRTLFTRPNLERVLLDTDLDLRLRNDAEREAYMSRIQSQGELSRTRRENIFTISYVDPDPALARDVVQALLNIWIENTLGGSRADFSEAQDFLDSQILDYEARLEEAEARLKDFQRRNQGLMPGAAGTYYQRVSAAGEQVKAAELELQQARSRREALELRILSETNRRDILSGEDAALANELIELPIQARIETLRQQLDLLLLQYTDQFPDVIYIKEMIAMLEQERDEQLAELRRNRIALPNGESSSFNPILQELSVTQANEEARIAELESLVETLSADYAQMQTRLDRIPEVEAQLVALNRNYASTKAYYDELVSRREATDIGEAAKERQDISFEIVDPPRLPTRPAGPNRPVLTSGVLVAGVGAGVGLAFLIAQLRIVVDSRRLLSLSTGLPVFGTVSDVRSVAAIRWERLGILIFVFLSGLLFMVYAGLVIWQVTGGISLPIGRLPFL